MFNKQTFYSINKSDPNSIVYLGSDGHLLRLTSEDFSSPEEFRIWKKWSDEQYHQVENADHIYFNHTISLENLSALADVVPGPELMLEQKEEAQDLKYKSNGVIYKTWTRLTDVQFRRLWMYEVEGKSMDEIALEEGVSVPAILKSIQAALKKVKNL